MKFFFRQKRAAQSYCVMSTSPLIKLGKSQSKNQVKVSPIDPILKLHERDRHKIHSIRPAQKEWNWIVRNYRYVGIPLSLLQCLLAIFFQRCECSDFSHHACKRFFLVQIMGKVVIHSLYELQVLCFVHHILSNISFQLDHHIFLSYLDYNRFFIQDPWTICSFQWRTDHEGH